MKTEYWYTNFPEITDTIRKSARIRGRARGVNLVPLASGQLPPGEDSAPVEESVEPQEERRSIFTQWAAEGDEREG
jgi:hypothetical protein